MKTRETSSSIFVFGLFVFILVAITLDSTLFRPREAIYGSDKRFLEEEMNAIEVATDGKLEWSDRSTIGRTSYVVSSLFSSAGNVTFPHDLVANILEQRGWKTVQKLYFKEIRRLCKGKYRASISQVPSGALGLALTVKDRKGDDVC